MTILNPFQLSAPLEAKYHVLELSSELQENRVKLLEQLKAAESVLDSEHIRNAPALAGQLAQMSIRQAQQAELVHRYVKICIFMVLRGYMVWFIFTEAYHSWSWVLK